MRQLLGVSATIGALLLADAPAYSARAGAAEQGNTTLAIVGALLITPWAAYQLRLMRHQANRQRAGLPSLHEAAVSRWRWLLTLAGMYCVGAAADAPIHVTAPLALATVGLAAALLWRILVLSLALTRSESSRRWLRLGWLGLMPCSLGCMAGAFLLAGDSWITLLLGCICSGAGPLAAARVLHARRPHTAAPAPEPEPDQALPS